MFHDNIEQFKETLDFTITKADDERRIVEGFLTSPVIDSDGELLTLESFNQVMPIVMKRGGALIEEHSNKICGKVLGWKVMDVPQTCRVVKENGSSKQDCKPGIWVQAEIFKDFPTDDETWNAIKSGEIRGFSFGGHVQKYNYECNKEVGGCYNKANGLSVFEVSVVRRPANPVAFFTNFNKMAKSQDSPLKQLINSVPSLRVMKDELVKKGMATTEAFNAVRCFVCKSLEKMEEKILTEWNVETENDIVKNAGLNSIDEFMNTCGFCQRKLKSLHEKGVPEMEAKSQLRRLVLKALVSYNTNKGGEKNMSETEKVAAEIAVAEVKSENVVKEAKDSVVGDALRELKEVVEKLAAKLEDVGKKLTDIKPTKEPEKKPDEKPEEKKPEVPKPAAPAAPPALPRPTPPAGAPPVGGPTPVGGPVGAPKPIAPPRKEEGGCPKCGAAVCVCPEGNKEETVGEVPANIAPQKIDSNVNRNTDKEEELRRKEEELNRKEEELRRKEEELLAKEEAAYKYASKKKDDEDDKEKDKKTKKSEEGSEVTKEGVERYDPHRDPTDLIVSLDKDLKKIYETYETVQKALNVIKSLDYKPRANQGTAVLGKVEAPVRGETVLSDSEGEKAAKAKKDDEEDDKKKKVSKADDEPGKSGAGLEFDPRATSDTRQTLGKVQEVKDDIRVPPQKLSAVLAARKALKSAKELEDKLKSKRAEVVSKTTTPKPRAEDGGFVTKSADAMPTMDQIRNMNWSDINEQDKRYQMRKRLNFNP